MNVTGTLCKMERLHLLYHNPESNRGFIYMVDNDLDVPSFHIPYFELLADFDHAQIWVR